ncbi:S8 family serine peptidase [Brumicola nitratireducens]|uniref:Peptidase S8/S53 domain-containing protein n=1 Tax=Glaciecola nitratireducens (strain JCM 12485 / KCTC 12276 / FR1064) TaxID=1085623 RepID=G4QNV8_GLANF|nr:S8 family serine peptidase [Glaciecola nitratireducens]AEP31666.1 hypothetical protein GNIT_3572 [Glaciecola nitratireducens FR1064]
MIVFSRPLRRGLILTALLQFCFSSFANADSTISEKTLPSVSDDTLTVTTTRSDGLSTVKYYPAGPQRYIVELTSPGLIEQQQLLAAENPSVNRLNTRLSAELRNYQSALQQEHQTLLSYIGTINQKILPTYQFTHTINAIVVEASPNEVDKIRSLPNVKRVVADQVMSRQLSESVSLVRANDAWLRLDNAGATLTGNGIVVAVLDTGIDYTHSALGGCFGEGCKVIAGYDFHYDDDDPMDIDGHGTHVAGIVAGNSESLRGVAPDAKLHAYKVLGDEGFGYTSNILAGIERAIDPDQNADTEDRVDVINMSLGGNGNAEGPLSQAVDRATQAGIVVVVSAGNNGNFNDIANLSPSSARTAITVASSTKSDQLSSFSSKGDSQADAPLKPELSAPGDDIFSASPGENIISLSGTSMAAPHVAGAAAILLQQFPELTAAEVKQRLMASARDIGFLPHAQGAGRLDIIDALDVSLASAEGIVDFGNITQQTGSYQSDLSLTLHNLSNQPVVLAVDSEQTFPNGVLIEVPETISIAARAKVSVQVSLIIDEVGSLDASTLDNLTFVDSLLFESGESRLRVPVTFQKAFEIQFEHNANSDTQFNIYGENSFYRRVSVRAGETAIVKIPTGEKTLLIDYGWIRFSDIGMPNPVESAMLIGQALERFTVNGNDTYRADISQLQFVFGVGQVLDDNGTELAQDDYENPTSAFELAFDDRLFSSNTAGGNTNKYYAFNTIPSDTTLQVGTLVTRSLEGGGAAIYNPFKQYQGGLTESVFINLNMQQRANYEHFASEPLKTKVDQLKITLQGPNSGGFTDTIDDVVYAKLYIPDEDARQGKIELSFRQKTTEDPYEGKLVASAELFTINQQGLFERDGLNRRTLQREATESLYLDGQGTYWHHPLSIENSVLKNLWDWSWAWNFDFPMLRDAVGNTYGDGLDLELEWLCDGQSVAIERYLRTNEYPLPESCTAPVGKLTFPTVLNNQTHRSTLTFEVETSGYQKIETIRDLGIMIDNTLLAKSAINQLQSLLAIEVNSEIIEDVAAEIRLGDDPSWYPLAVADIWYGESIILFDLPMLFGEHIASLRITTQSGTVQTLDHFTTLGSEAGGGNDVDGDGIANEQDDDNDNDGFIDNSDAFPLNPAEWLDTDADGLGNNADNDDDNDGVADGDDAFPLDAAESVDTDNDGIGNNSDTDDDNDGVADNNDAFPLDPTESLDTDSDGIGNNADSDDDNDGTADVNDAFPLDSTEQVDTDGDGIGNNADSDDDNDGVPDNSDAFPLDPSRSTPTATQQGSNGGGGGGSLSPYMLLLICLAWRRRAQKSR